MMTKFKISPLLYTLLFAAALTFSCAKNKQMKTNLLVEPNIIIEEDLLAKVNKFYIYLENKKWNKIYDMLGSEYFTETKEKYPEKLCTKTEFTDDLNNSLFGKLHWEFDYLKLKKLILRKNRAYIEMEVTLRDLDEMETSPPETWYDEWVHEDGEWKINRILYDAKPKEWPKD